MDSAGAAPTLIAISVLSVTELPSNRHEHVTEGFQNLDMTEWMEQLMGAELKPASQPDDAAMPAVHDVDQQRMRILRCTAKSLANSLGGLRFKANTRPWLDELSRMGALAATVTVVATVGEGTASELRGRSDEDGIGEKDIARVGQRQVEEERGRIGKDNWYDGGACFP